MLILFRVMFVDGKFGNQMIVDTLMGLGIEKFKQQFDAEQYSMKDSSILLPTGLLLLD